MHFKVRVRANPNDIDHITNDNGVFTLKNSGSLELAINKPIVLYE